MSVKSAMYYTWTQNVAYMRIITGHKFQSKLNKIK